MKAVSALLFVLFFAGCDSKHIAIYAINMMYACECPQFRVFRVEDNNANKQNIDINKALDDEIRYALYINGEETRQVATMQILLLAGI